MQHSITFLWIGVYFNVYLLLKLARLNLLENKISWISLLLNNMAFYVTGIFFSKNAQLSYRKCIGDVEILNISSIFLSSIWFGLCMTSKPEKCRVYSRSLAKERCSFQRSFQRYFQCRFLSILKFWQTMFWIIIIVY